MKQSNLGVEVLQKKGIPIEGSVYHQNRRSVEVLKERGAGRGAVPANLMEHWCRCPHSWGSESKSLRARAKSFDFRLFRGLGLS